MLKRIAVVVVWVLAALGTASLTYAAVSQAGDAVGENPAMPVNASDIAARVSTTLGTTTLALDGTSTTNAGVTTTAVSGTTAATTSTSTTAAPASTTTAAGTTTTAAAAHTEYKTVPGVGTVGVSVQGNSVWFLSAQPVAPFYAERKDGGPDHVVVTFESEQSEYDVKAEVHDGVVVWEVTGGGAETDH